VSLLSSSHLGDSVSKLQERKESEKISKAETSREEVGKTHLNSVSNLLVLGVGRVPLVGLEKREAEVEERRGRRVTTKSQSVQKKEFNR